MLRFAISAESSGPFPLPGQHNRATELIALRIVTLPENKVVCDKVFTRSDGQFIRFEKNSTTEDMVIGRPSFVEKAHNIAPLIMHKDDKGNFDTVFFCFGKGFYEELFRRYGLFRDGLFVDLLPAVRDIRDLQARANMPSNAAGSKLPTIDEVASFFGVDWPKVPTPRDKTELILDVFNWRQESMNRLGRGQS